jgi:hypothetical protein
MNRPARLIGATVLLAIGAGCAPAPIYKPITVGDVDAGANSVEAARRQFQGASLWLTINGADGKPTAASSWKKSQ